MSDPFSTEIEMQALDSLADPLSVPDFIPSSSLSEMTDSSQSQAWSSGVDTPLHSTVWSTATNIASPTSSNLSAADYFLNDSPFTRRGDGSNMMIGKSAWDHRTGSPQTRASSHPRHRAATLRTSAASPPRHPPRSRSPTSTTACSTATTCFPHRMHTISRPRSRRRHPFDVSDPDVFAPSSFRGFTHHSNYAGDLIFGARTHQPQYPMDYGPGFGFGSAGLGIDEIELTSITLDDHLDVIRDPMEDESIDTAMPKDPQDPSLTLSGLASFSLQHTSLEAW
ncbi:hypothetical protein A0H81_05256 [Grifola frondosa]|uniref:Uncharacterized protein n=1 Tax=Grifola frondosa TaxID=5627 RepID=A0A1C7MC81_GRIFR|nr:hypothetical protein A0H81_05256 [Grifola frondosa]